MSEIKFNSGQSVQPAYEGWTRNPDGSRSMWFGYMNRNWEETPEIPAGAGNGFGAAAEDLGQPTHFLPRRQAFVFKVDIPADWPADRDLVWTVTANGTTLKAYGSLWRVWEIDEPTMSANNGGRTARPAHPGASRQRRRPADAGNPRAWHGRSTGSWRCRPGRGDRSVWRGGARPVPREVGSVPRGRQRPNHPVGIGRARNGRQTVADRRHVIDEGDLRQARHLHAARVRPGRRRILHDAGCDGDGEGLIVGAPHPDTYSASTSAPRSALLAAMILACSGEGTSS